MKWLLVFFLFFLVMGTACKEVKKTPTPSGVNLLVHDISCPEVKNRLVKELRKQGLPFDWADKDQGFLSVGPINTTPFQADPFIKTEEIIRLEIKCSDPQTTRISLQIQVRGLTSDHQWLEVNDPDKLNVYGKRFLDRLIVK